MERARSSGQRRRCPYCHDALGVEVIAACGACRAVHHAACWQELGGCASCRRVVSARALEKVPAGLVVEERDGALTITRRETWRSGLAWLGGWAASVAAALYARTLPDFAELPAAVGAAVAVVLAIAGAGALLNLAGRVRVSVGRGQVAVTEDALGVPLAPALRVDAAAVTDVLERRGYLVLVTGERRRSRWFWARPDEVTWIAARVRRQLGLA